MPAIKRGAILRRNQMTFRLASCARSRHVA
jgi:hypothetical protein